MQALLRINTMIKLHHTELHRISYHRNQMTLIVANAGKLIKHLKIKSPEVEVSWTQEIWREAIRLKIRMTMYLK